MSSRALDGRTALITGASRGIGRATAVALAHAGARVVLIARSAQELQNVAASIREDAVAIPCDVTDAAAVARMVMTVMDICGGAPNIVVNNAGLFPIAALDVMAVDDFERTINVNLIAPFRVLRAFLPTMRARGTGHVVTIGSVADRTVFAGNGAYAASKYGQRAMQEVLRAELRGSGMRSTLVSPAATDTPIWDPIDPDTQPGFPTRASMLRAEDVADAVLWAVLRPTGVNVDEIRVSSA